NGDEIGGGGAGGRRISHQRQVGIRIDTDGIGNWRRLHRILQSAGNVHGEGSSGSRVLRGGTGNRNGQNSDGLVAVIDYRHGVVGPVDRHSRGHVEGNTGE